jgi:hypothetical protein
VPYSERYVAFADILGFSEIVMKTAKDTNTVRFDNLVSVLEGIGALEGERPNLAYTDFQYQTFSDSIVISTVSTPTGLTDLLLTLVELTLRLMMNGLLLRGAIAKGKLYHRGTVMFGPAFIDAYNIERTIAKFPRIVLNRATYEDIRELASDVQFPTVRLADDGPAYLHVLAPLQQPEADPTRSAICRTIIQQLLDDSIHFPDRYDKLRWGTIYWNSTVALGSSTLRITFPNTPSGWP